jgi:hypothetical protein
MRVLNRWNQIKGWWQLRNGTEKLEISFQGVIALATLAYVTVALIQWSAMRKSNDISREALQSVQSALIYFREFSVVPLIAPTGDLASVLIMPNIENGGATPAKEVVSQVNCGVTDSGMPTDYVFRDQWCGDSPAPPQEQAALVIMPKQEVGTGPAITINPTTLKAIVDHTKYFYLWGRITYRDVFKNTRKHVVQYCRTISYLSSMALTAKNGAQVSMIIGSCPNRTYDCLDEGCKN